MDTNAAANPNQAYCFTHHDAHLLIILGFVITLVAIGRYFRYRSQKMWHDTVRLALEKGQPLPANWSDYSLRGRCYGRWNPWWNLRAGLVLIAVGAALYCALPGPERMWAAVPAFIGIAKLIFALFSFFQGDRPSDLQDRDATSKK